MPPTRNSASRAFILVIPAEQGGEYSPWTLPPDQWMEAELGDVPPELWEELRTTFQIDLGRFAEMRKRFDIPLAPEALRSPVP